MSTKMVSIEPMDTGFIVTIEYDEEREATRHAETYFRDALLRAQNMIRPHLRGMGLGLVDEDPYFESPDRIPP